MKTVLALSLLAALAALALAETFYTTQWDNIDLNKILNDDRLLLNYFNCVMGKPARCSEPAKTLREHMEEAIATRCAKCTERQKQGAEKIISFLIENKRDLWDQVEEKFEGMRDFRMKYEALKAQSDKKI